MKNKYCSLLITFLVSISVNGQIRNIEPSELLPAPREGGFRMDNYWVWGASVVEHEGVFHMYATRVPMEYKFHPGWMIAGEIVHATSKNLEGPYTFSEVALERRGRQYWDGMSVYNPQILKWDNRFYLFYGATTHPFETPQDSLLSLASKWTIASRANKRIGLAVSDNPHGPWVRRDNPVIDVEPNTFYSYLTSNPAPVILPDGQTYVIFKGRHHTDEHKYSTMQLGVAYAKHIDSLFVVMNDKMPIFQNLGEAEDPFLWYDKGMFYTVFKDHVGKYTQERGAGVKAYSVNCIDWHICNPAKAYSKTVVWDDGSVTKQGNLERAFIFFDKGIPLCFFFATMDGTGFNGKKAWNMTVPIKH